LLTRNSESKEFINFTNALHILYTKQLHNGENKMSLRFCSLSSGSSGNCYLLQSPETVILVDAGISARRVFENFSRLGIEKSQLSALLVTHEHTDHIRCISPIIKGATSARVFANEETWGSGLLGGDPARRETFSAGTSFQIGDIEVFPFAVSHDTAGPVGFSFRCGGKQVSIITDTGCVPEELLDELAKADLLVLEANHDVDMLKICSRPYAVKQRTLGDFGHLSNDTAGEILVKLVEKDDKGRRVILAHLSRENNFPEMAYQTVKNILERAGCCIGKNLFLEVADRESAGPFYEV